MTIRLATTQREIARLVRAAEGVRAELALGDTSMHRDLDGLIRGDASLGAVDRLEVYANAYFYRLRDVLTEEYESLSAAVGDAGFNDLVTAYLLVHPSGHPSVRWVGRRLPEFLAAHPAALPFRTRWPWAADLARLEWSLSEAFDGADALLLCREDLAAIDPDCWNDLVFTLHPTARLLRLEWPVQHVHDAVISSARDRELLETIPTEPEETRVLVWRRDERPQSRVLDRVEANLVDDVKAGRNFGDLCGRVAESVGPEEAPAAMARILGLWVETGALARRHRAD